METIEKDEYDYTLLDRLLIGLFTRKMAQAVGSNTKLKGYEGLVDLSKQVVQDRTAKAQQEVIGKMMRSLIPPYVLAIIRTLFPPSQLILEWNAWFANRMFEWLVGPCELRSIEVVGTDGQLRTQRSSIHIKKCRYLEHSGCVGMCINMCKLPTQEFFEQEFGFPLRMIPNFEDLSCDMNFGQKALPLAGEPEYHQPCLATQCDLATSKPVPCPKVRQ